MSDDRSYTGQWGEQNSDLQCFIFVFQCLHCDCALSLDERNIPLCTDSGALYFSHKDYLFQRRLAHRLLMDSFRFDFRYVLLILP